MQKLIFVMGVTTTGKTYFIRHHFADENFSVLDVFDYQQRAYDEAGYKDSVPLFEQFRCLKRANEMHLHDIIEELKQGHDVVAEQTFFKAKRRIAYIEEIRKVADVRIEIYVMQPDDERWENNIKRRGNNATLQRLKCQAEDIEFPNPAEGFDAIYEVINDEIKLRMDEPKPEIILQAKQELLEEEERLRKEDEEKRKKQELREARLREIAARINRH